VNTDDGQRWIAAHHFATRAGANVRTLDRSPTHDAMSGGLPYGLQSMLKVRERTRAREDG
jgi:hypothetical protein